MLGSFADFDLGCPVYVSARCQFTFGCGDLCALRVCGGCIYTRRHCYVYTIKDGLLSPVASDAKAGRDKSINQSS
jgi:hypothetical protein